MKAVTVKQPWAGLIMAGMKNVENRTWVTNHRGKILIHSTKTLNYAEEKRAEDFIARKILTREEQRVLNVEGDCCVFGKYSFQGKTEMDVLLEGKKYRLRTYL